MTESCLHLTTVPVVLTTGETVATVCETCLEKVPASWGCEDCHYVDAISLRGTRRRVMAYTCERHS